MPGRGAQPDVLCPMARKDLSSCAYFSEKYEHNDNINTTTDLRCTAHRWNGGLQSHSQTMQFP